MMSAKMMSAKAWMLGVVCLCAGAAARMASASESPGTGEQHGASSMSARPPPGAVTLSRVISVGAAGSAPRAVPLPSPAPKRVTRRMSRVTRLPSLEVGSAGASRATNSRTSASASTCPAPIAA